MPPTITTQGADYYAQVILGQRAADTYQVLLFVNFHLPSVNDTLAQYTECTWPGYSRFTLKSSEWTGLATSGLATYQYPLLTWVLDASAHVQQTVFGYAVLTESGTLLYAEAFSAPFPIPPEGGQIPIQLFWADEQCPA